ncbi:hypothetical protein FBR05_07880 [Deltaproteobacteria bacterium PRO3]|nr:hypothetical protein [Deltaproteobacteria bacterium PRO3]
MELPWDSGSGAASPAAETALLLARAMENTEQPGPLSRALGEGGAGSLREAWGRLSASERREIQGRLGEGAVEEILSLAAEREARALGEGLISLGIRLENAERLDAAAGVFAVVAGALREGPLQERARARLDAILGRGAVLPRMEFLGRRLAAQASDPAMIAGMAGAGLAFRMTRLAALSRLSAGSGFLSRPWVARGLANVAGFGVESVAFTGSVRAANAALGRTQDWSARALWQEYAAGTLTLGALKLTGALARLGVSRIGPHPSILGRFTQAALPQAALFGGILLSHDLEARLGLRPHVDGATSITDALGTLLQFHVGGRLAREVSGPRLQRLEQELERRATALEADGARAPRVAFQRPLRDYVPERLVSWARRLGRLGRGAAYAPLWTLMGIGFGGGFGGPPRRFVETRTLRVENIPVQVEIFHRSEIPRDTIRRIEAGLRRIFEEGVSPVDFDGEAENLAGDRHFILQRLRNGGPTMRARLEISALGTLARFEITEAGKRPYVLSPELAEPEAPSEVSVAAPEPVAAGAEAESVSEAPHPTVISVSETLPSAAPAAEVPTRQELEAPELPVESLDLATEATMETVPPARESTVTPVVPPGMRLRPPHRRLLGVSPAVQLFELIPRRERRTASFELREREFSLDSEIEVALANLYEEIRHAEPWEAAQEVYQFLIERHWEYRAETRPKYLDPQDSASPRREQFSGEAWDLLKGETHTRERIEVGLRFPRLLQGVQELIQRLNLAYYQIIPDEMGNVGSRLLSVAYSQTHLRSWMGNRSRISLGGLVQKLIRTFGHREDRGIVDPTPRRRELSRGGPNSPPAPAAPDRGSSGPASGGSNLDFGGDSSRPRGTSPRTSASTAESVSEPRPGEAMPEAQDPSRAFVGRPIAEGPGVAERSAVPARSQAHWGEVRGSLRLLDAEIGRLMERDPERAEAARRLYFQVRALREQGVSAEGAMEAVRLLSEHLGRGTSLRNVERDFRTASRARILARLAEWLESDPEMGPVVRRAMNLFRELAPTRGWSLGRSFSALDVLEQVLAGDPARLSPQQWTELFDSFEARIRREAPFAEVLAEQRAWERRSRPAVAAPSSETVASEEAPRVERRPTLLPPPAPVFSELEITAPLMLPQRDGGYRQVSVESFSTGLVPGRGLTALFSRPARLEQEPLETISLRSESSVEISPQRMPPESTPVDELEALREDLTGLSRREAVLRVLNCLERRLSLTIGDPLAMAAELRQQVHRLPADFLPRLRGLVREQGLGNESFLSGESLNGLGLNRRELASQSRIRTLDQYLALLEGMAPRAAAGGAPAGRTAPRSLRRAPGRAARPEPRVSEAPLPSASPGERAESPQPAEASSPPAVELPSFVPEPESLRPPLAEEVRAPEIPPAGEVEQNATARASVSEPAPVADVETLEQPSRPQEIATPIEVATLSPGEARPTPPPSRPSPIPARPPRLASWIPDGSGLPVARIEGYLRANEMQRRLIVPPTLEEFAAVRAALEGRLPGAEPAEAESIRACLRSLDEALREPTGEEIQAFNRASLDGMSETAQSRFAALSENAQRGLYLLLLALPQAQRRNLAVFLANPEALRLRGGMEEVLSGVAFLHDLGVRGYEHGFLPVPGNAKYLGLEENPVQGTHGEYQEALRTALDPAVERVWMGAPLRIRWHRLPLEQREFIEREVRPLFENRGYDYTRQQASEVDQVYRTVAGRRRLAEVKVSRRSNYSPGSEEIGKILLQVFRHGLLVRQHDLEGMDYRITAPSVDSRWILRLRETLDRTGVPWTLTVRETAAGREQVFESGMSALRGGGALSARRLRPFPSAPGRTEAAPPAGARVETPGEAEPWSEAMVDFLNLGLEGPQRLSRRLNREASQAQLIADLRVIQQRALAEEIEVFMAGEGAALPEPRQRRIAELLRQFRLHQGETMSRNRTGILFEIAALAVGERLTAEELSAGGDAAIRDVERSLRNNRGMWLSSLANWRDSLDALEVLSREMSAAELEESLSEYSADRVVDISTDTLGQGGLSLREMQAAIEEGRMNVEGEVHDAVRVIVELYDALGGELRLREE